MFARVYQGKVSSSHQFASTALVHHGIGGPQPTNMNEHHSTSLFSSRVVKFSAATLPHFRSSHARIRLPCEVTGPPGALRIFLLYIRSAQVCKGFQFLIPKTRDCRFMALTVTLVRSSGPSIWLTWCRFLERIVLPSISSEAPPISPMSRSPR